MSKIRVHELAKELNKSSKDIIYALKGHGVLVESHMSTVSDDSAEKIRKYFTAAPVKKQEAPRTQDQAHAKAPASNEQKPFNNNGGQNRQGGNGERRFNNNNGGQNRQGGNGERRFNNNNGGQNRQGGNGERRFNNNNGGQNRQGGNGERRFNNNNGGQNRQGGNGERRPFNNNNGGQNRQGGYNNNNNRDNRGGNRGYNNRGEGKFNLDSAISKEVVVSKDTSRESRRNYKDKEKPVKSVTDGRTNSKKGFGGKPLSKKTDLQKPVQKPKPAAEKVTNIILPEVVTIKELGDKMKISGAEIVKKLFLSGKMVTLNTEVTYDEAEEIALEYDILCEHEVVIDPIEEILKEDEENEDDLQPRPPVVCVMGHVDHGKTSILDAIRNTHVTTGEAGGITQHIGAYQVKCQGKKIVFLDTPGHEAFTAMRARGAQVTDIAILVVAADDGVMPQTIEAINHAKSAEVPIIVAINKIDKPGADPSRVKNELMEHGLVSEEYGGDTIMVEVSAKKNLNIDSLLEMVILVAEMGELKANPRREARGVIIEAQLDKGRGPVATVLVQNGTMHIGDSIIAGTCYGKIRAMINDRGENVKKAGPSVPVEVLGLNDVPAAGDELAVLEEKLCRSIAEKRIEKHRNDLIRSKKVSLDDLFQQIQDGSIKDLNILVKADVQGSVEALNSSLLALNKNDEVRINIVHSGVGAVNESDVMLATASNALIIAFNVRPDANARRIAESEDIDIRTYRVIYDAINDVKDAMSGMLAPKYKEVIQGRVEIRQVMIFNKTLMVAGSYVLEGKITNKSKIRIVRDNIEVFDGELDDLRRFKDAVKEVAAGYECGITIKEYRDFREGDIIEAYTMEEIKTNINDVNRD